MWVCGCMCQRVCVCDIGQSDIIKFFSESNDIQQWHLKKEDVFLAQHITKLLSVKNTLFFSVKL